MIRGREAVAVVFLLVLCVIEQNVAGKFGFFVRVRGHDMHSIERFPGKSFHF